jgi:hypothetical protein
MPHPFTSKKRAQVVSTSALLFGLAILIFTENWWPGIMLAIGLPLAIRQFLMGRKYDMNITLLVFGGTFVTVAFDIPWKTILPVLFSLGAIYVLLREFFEIRASTEREREEDINQELDEEEKDL